MAAKVKRPAGYYSREQREERRRVRSLRRAEREADAADRRQRVERRSAEIQARAATVAKRIATAAVERARTFKTEKDIPLLPGESEALYRARVDALWSAVKRQRGINRHDHHNEGTPETHWKAEGARQGALSRLFLAGYIDPEQLGWACEIGAVAEMIERDVAVRGCSYEMRVDYSGSGRNVLVEGIVRVRREVAYTWWRERIPHPKRAILDMLVGEPKSYTDIAKQWRMGKVRARKLLIDAIDLWEQAREHAETMVDPADLAAAHAAIAGG